MQHSPSTPKKKGSESGAAASSASESSPSRNTLFVPPPEQPWTGAALARALATTNTGTHVDVADKNNVAATTLFSFPYTFPSVSQGDGAARKLPPLSSLLQLPTHTSGADSVALYPAAPLAPQPYDNGTSQDAGGRGDGLATTALAAAPLPLGHSSKSSWPTPSVSGATQAGATAAADSQGHSFSSVSSATTTTTLISDTNTDAASAGATADRSDAATTTPPTAQITVAAAACSSSLAMSAARSPPQQSSQAASSFTDLFVGLERPRLHRGPRCEEARASVMSCEGASATSHLFSLIQCSNSLEASSHDEVEEDEGGAHTPTVYRSTRLPHWWRSIVTPSIGTRVCLRPNTPRLEFWWIDRLGSEAYELMQVILKHSLEGVVTRESAESVVVVEFTIPAAYLDTTSFAVWPDSAATDVARAAAAGAANDSATAAAAAHVKDGGGAAACIPPAWEAAEDGERTLDGTACTTAPPFDSNEGTVAPSPVGSAHAAATTPRLSAAAASTMTVGRTTGTPSTTFSEAPPSAVFAGLPVLVGADSPRHDDAVDSGLHHALAINSAAAAADAAGAVVVTAAAAASNASTPTITALQSMATSVFTDSKANGGVAAPPRDLTSVPSLRRSDSDSTASPSSPQRLLSSFSLDVVPGHTSLSTVERSGSVVTVAGRHSDPFAAERRLHNEPSLTRILKTSPHEKPFPTTAAQQMQRLQPPGSGRNAMLRTPVTPGERGYSPDPSEDTANDTSAKDSNTAEHDSAEAAAVPLVPRQQQQQEERTGSANSRDNDHSLVHVEPVPKGDDGSLCLLNSVESPFRWPSPSSHPYRLPSPRHSSYAHVTVYPDGCQPSKTYGEWLRTTHTTSSLGGSANGTSGLVAAAAPWSHDSPEETTNFLGRITSSSDNDDTTSASAAAAAKRTGNCHHHRDDDDVLVRLSLPSSVCIPVVAVRLHALGLLHPFLDAITIPYDMPSFNTDSNDDDDDDDGMGGALRTATQASPFTSELVEQTATPDYNTAVQLISAAITRAEQARQMSTAAGATADAKEEGPAASDAPPPLPTAPRDLSILYTVRSHLHFHMSPEFLFDSLKDAEMALACCPTHEHVCHTYEVLTACLISFGHTAQVERVAAHLRHRCRTPTPLLTRLGRVTQVMVSYGTLFLRQQLNPALLRCATATAREGGKRASAPVLLSDGVQSSPLDGAAYLSRAQLPPPPSASSASSAAAQAAALVAASADGASLVVSTTAMPLVVVGGGIVDPPAGWDGGQQQQQARHSTTTIATTTTTASGAVVHAAQTATALAPRTLPYEVCPLLLGYYGKSLHRPNDVPRHPYPPPLSPHSSACHPAAQRHRHYMSRPSSDVCHRRLFLLETLFPSVMPLTAMNRLQQVFSMPRPNRHRGSVGARGFQAMRHSLCKGGTDTAETGAVVATAKAEKKIKAEDFMYDRDSMFALLATSSETAIPYGTVSMRYFGRHIRLSATRRIPKGETVLLERPALMLALWPLPPPRASCTTSGGPWRQPSSAALPRAAPAYCAQCGRQPLSHPVRCPGDCGSHYCSEGCRCEALRLYHVMECCCGGGGGGSGAPGRDAGSSANSNDDDDDARVRRAVAALHPIFAEWEAFIYHFANWNTPSTRSATPVASCSPSVSASLSSTPPEPTPDPPAAAPPPAEKKSPPPVLAAAGLRAMARLVAMILGLVLPVERLPQWQQAGRTAATVASWTEKRHANFRAVARTLHGRGLLVPAGSGRAANLYCTGVDPHRLLLLEVLLQQLSVPFFADFTYRAPSTVWEAMEQFPCAVQHGVSAATTAGRNAPPDDEAGTPPSSASRPASNTLGAPLIIPFAARATRPPPTPGRRHWTVELTMAQRQELMVTIHALLQRIHAILSAELAAVSVLPPTAPAQRGDEAAAAGAPGLWRCAALLGFLPSTRVFEELFDFCLTSCAVVYPKNAEPEAVGGLGSSESGSPAPSTHSRASAAAATAAVPAADRKTSDSAASAAAPPAVPMAVISPWTCLTVDLLPILGHSPGGVIYSRFMVEHEQRRRMIAYCAAAATRHGAGGGSGGSSGYGSGVENDSFLSIHSMASASAAAVLGGSANSPANDDLGRSGTLKEDWSLKMLEEAASRSCANLNLSLVHSPLPTEAGRPSMVAVVMTTKKSVQLGDVLWWESLNFGEYLHALF